MNSGPPFDRSPDPELETLEILANGLRDELDDAEQSSDPDLKTAQIKFLKKNVDSLMCMLGWAVTSERLGEKFQIKCAGSLELKSGSLSSTDAQEGHSGEEICSEDEAFSSLRSTSAMHMSVCVPREVNCWIDPVFMRVLSLTSRPGPPSRDNCTITRTDKACVPGARDGQFYRVGGFIVCSDASSRISDLDNITADGCDLSWLREYQYPTQFFFVKCVSADCELKLQVPQAILEMHACAMCLEKKVIRGVITNAHEWMFLLLELNNDCDGGVYYQSEMIHLMDPDREELDREVFVLITKIVAHWASRTHEEIGNDDLFICKNFEAAIHA